MQHFRKQEIYIMYVRFQTQYGRMFCLFLVMGLEP